MGLAQGQPAPYDLARHVTYLDSKFQIVRETASALATRKIDAQEGVRKLGEILGESRKLQADLTAWLKSHPQSPGKRVMRLIQAQDLFEGYLATELLALDGDLDSKTLAKSLEARLTTLIPLLKK